MTEEQVLQLFAEDNPVPSIDDIDLPVTSIYLETLEKRSDVMLTEQTETREIGEKSSQLRLAVAAAAAVVIGLLALFMSGIWSQDDVPPVNELTTTSVSTPEPRVEEFEAIPEWLGMASAGTRARSPIFGVPFSFVAKELWGPNEANDESSFILVRQPVAGGTPMPVAVGAFMTEDTVEELIGQYEDLHDQLGAQMSAPKEASVGSARGMTFESRGLPWTVEDPQLVPLVRRIEFGGNTSYQTVGAERGQIFVVDVEGQTVVVAYWALESVFDDFADEALAFIDSIEWRDLP